MSLEERQVGGPVFNRPDEISAVVNLADELYRRRAEGNTGGRLLAVLNGCEGAVESYEVQWRLARALFLDGQASDKDALKFHEAGVAHGRNATRLSRDRVEGHFWLGVNLALLAQQAHPLRAPVAVLQARAELRRAASICQEYHGAGPLRVLGRLEHKAPWFLGGSTKRARTYYDRALGIAAGNCVTLMYAAELAIDEGESARAVELLQRIVESQVDPAWEFEHARDEEAAKAMLAQLRQLSPT